MPDITMCPATPTLCPLAPGCHRTTAQQSEHRQAWFVDVPYRDGNCAYYTPAAVSRTTVARRRLRVVR